MNASFPSILVDTTQVRDLHSGVARRLINLWPQVIEKSKNLSIGIVAYDFMVASLSQFFPDCEILVAKDFGEGPRIRRRRLNPHLAELRKTGGYDWIFQDGLLPCDRRTILTIHDLRFKAAGIHPPWRRAFMAGFLQWTLRGRKTPTLTVSNSMKQEIVATLGLKAERVFVVPNGVDTQRFILRENIAEELNDLGLEPGRFRLFVGHLEDRKNPKFLLDLHRYGRGQGDQTRLVVAAHTRSAPSESHRWKETWQEEPGVIFFESPHDELLAALYQGAACFLMPSKTEGFSMTPLESLAMGTPVLASDIDAHKETLGPVFCQPLDVHSWHRRLLELANPSTKTDLLEFGNERLKALSWDRAAFDLVSLLQVIRETSMSYSSKRGKL